MIALSDCPALERWQAFFADELPAEQRDGYEQHLESCPQCQARLDSEAGPPDDLLGVIRQVGDPTLAPDDPTLSHVLERLHSATSAERNSAGEPADLYFLDPTDRPGLLGMLGGYEVQEVLGQGGMGVVLKAFDPTLDRLVAIKVLAAAIAGSATARKRFLREARAAAAVCHDHVVTVHGVDEHDGLPYLVMQYVAGESLQERLDRAGPLEIEEVLRIGMQTAAGLAAAHAQGLIHRDIKPANILLEEKDEGGRMKDESRQHASSSSSFILHPSSFPRVKITDFGLARMADDVALTQNGVVAGTPEHMAPEQARGEAVDHRADLFSLGTVLYALCTGHPPFRGASTLAVLRQVSDAPAPPLRQLNPAVPAWLEAVVARLLAKDPGERFGSAAEVAALLEGYLAHLRQPATVPAPALAALAASGNRRGPRAGRRALLATGLLAAVILLGLGRLSRLFQAQAPAPAAQALRDELYQDFRGNKPIHTALHWGGLDGEEVIEPGEKGLRIQLTAKRTRKDPVCLVLGAGIKGDMEVTTGFELLEANPPKEGNGVGFELYVMLDTPTNEAIALVRVKRPDGSDGYICTHMQTVEGKRRYQTTTPPAAGKSGQLRMTRTGKAFTLWAAEEGGAFRELARYELEPSVLKMVRIAAYPGGAIEPVDVRIHDLRVRAEGELAAGGAAATAVTTRPAVGRTWLVAAEVAALAGTLALVPLLVWVRARRRRTAAAAPRPAKPTSPAAAPAKARGLSLTCPGCAKRINAKGELAGKKARCPSCGHVLLVPDAIQTKVDPRAR
jgi:serine/threonine-protein kinase